MTHRDGEENQEIHDIPVIEERIQYESRPMEPTETEICVRVETKITDEERLIIDELKSLMIRNETEEYLTFKKVDQRKLRDVTKKVNALISILKQMMQRKQITCYGSSPFRLQKKLE